MTITEIEAIFEAALFASGEAYTAARLAEIAEIDTKTAAAILEEMRNRYECRKSGFIITKIDDAFQMCTNPLYFEQVSRLLKLSRRKPLSQTALEVLAIIAYKQPVTKAQIEEIRGTNPDYVVNRLLEYDLIEEKGHASSIGRATLFGTSESFLRYFGLNALGRLPQLPEASRELEHSAQIEIDGMLRMDFSGRL